jgi:hypothetical protein
MSQMIAGEVEHLSFQGPFVHLDLRLPGGEQLLVEHRTERGPAPHRGERVSAIVRTDSLRLFAGA